jgi:hypothetical protein
MLDPSIYQNVGRVNLGEGVSNLIDAQRQREYAEEDRQNRLSAMAQQKQIFAQQQAEAQKQAQTKRGQDLNSWLSGAVQSGRPQEEIMAEAIAKGKEIGVAPEATQRHVMQVFQSAQTPQARSDFAFTQANPELVAKQRAEAMFRQEKQTSPISNINPKDYTQESFKSYFQGGMKDPSILRARESQDGITPAVQLAREKFEYEKTKPQKSAMLSPTAQKELFEADDTAQAAKNVQGILQSALELNDKTYSGYGAKSRAIARSNLPGTSEEADNTIQLDNMMTGQALESLKATFGGMPTEGERKILLEMQASADKTPAQRKDIMTRAIAAAKKREAFSRDRAKSLRAGTYFGEQTADTNAGEDQTWSDL